MKVHYYGCVKGSGHFFHDVHLQHDCTAWRDIPWANIDGKLCPRDGHGPQVEGEAALHHLGGWTALAFWDRSVDARIECNSVFFAEGTYGPDAMMQIAREHFPSIWARFKFEVRVVDVPHSNEIVNVAHVCAGCGKVGHGAVLSATWIHDPPGWFRRFGADEIRCSVACVVGAGG